MSLADDFLADLDDYEDTNALAPSESNTATSTFASSSTKHLADHDMDEDDMDGHDDFDEDAAMDNEADSALEAMMREVAAAKHARDIAKLMDSEDMKGILKVQAEFLTPLSPLWELQSYCFAMLDHAVDLPFVLLYHLSLML